MKKYFITIKIALITALAIILFQVIGLFVVYQYIRLDLYSSLVAVCFLMTGLFLRRPIYIPAPEQENETSRSPLNQLTYRELQILRCIADGKTNKEIAATHFVEVSTVKTHINNIYSKLSVSNRVQARLKYVEIKEKR